MEPETKRTDATDCSTVKMTNTLLRAYKAAQNEYGDTCDDTRLCNTCRISATRPEPYVQRGHLLTGMPVSVSISRPGQ
eukprot:965383-Rhodomonas_salina.1